MRFRLDIEIGKSDLIILYKYTQWLNPEKKLFRIKRRVQNGLTFGCFPLIILFFYRPSFSEALIWDLSFFLLLLFTLGYFMADKIILTNMENQSLKLLESETIGDLIWPITIELEDEVFTWRTLNSETKMRKSSAYKIGQSRGYYFILNSSISGYVIPKRGLSDEQKGEFEAWWGFTHAPQS
jgi:hypothetical protein